MSWLLPHHRAPLRRIDPYLVVLALGALVFTVGLNAWVCDDAYITLRSVEALLDGRGLVWNPGERVQAYTHPLWMALLALALLVVRDAYLAALVLGGAFTLATAVGLCRVGARPKLAALVLVGLAMSPSFVHFSTSGLENPASHLLLVAFTAVFVSPPSDRRPMRQYALVALLLLNRTDLLFLVLIPSLWTFYEDGRRRGWRRAVGTAALAASPVLAWELFTLVYYGSLVPNTAYAKLAHGLPRSEVAAQGVRFLANFGSFDPVGAAMLVVSLGAILRPRMGARHRALATGVLLSLAYVVWIGGDFMSGRMLTPALILALCGASTMPEGEARRPIATRVATALAAVVLVGLGMAPQRHVLMPLAESFDLPVEEGPLPRYATHWVGSERGHYASATSVWVVLEHDPPRPPHTWYDRGEHLGNIGGVHRVRNIGFAGYAADDGATLIDPYALSSAFLARLPAFRNLSWHVGHYQRVIPPGYERSVAEGTCHMDDPELCALFDDVWTVTRAPVFSEGRLDAIVSLHRFRPSEALTHRMRFGEVVRTASTPPRPVGFVDSGVRFPVAEEDSGRVAQLSPCLPFQLDYYAASERVAETRADGCRVPLDAGRAFDEVHIYPLERGPNDSNRYQFHGLVEAPAAR